VTDPHHNVFFYYRGQVRAKSEEEAERLREQQVEDNTTKALVNLLEWSDASLTQEFVSAFLPGSTPNPEMEGEPYEYFLQGGRAVDVPQRWLLAISQSEALPPPAPAASGGSRVDGGFIRPGELLVVFEVKLGSELDAAQLARHREHWRIPEGRTVPVPWASVYEWAAKERESRREPVTRFLLEQIVEYLELSRLKPFGGLESEDFEFFDNPTWERQPQVKAQLAALWEAVLASMPEKDAARLGAIHVGQLGLSDDHAWAQTNHGEEDKINLTLELSTRGLQLNLVGWQVDCAQRVQRWLEGEGSKTLVGFKGYEVVLHMRRPKNYGKRDEGARAWWQREVVSEVERIAADAGETKLRALTECTKSWDSRWEKPGFHLRRAWSRQEATAAKLELVTEVSTEVERLMPLLRELDED
jgi:hypothetical protein